MEYPKIHSLWKREGWYFDEKEKKGPQKPNRQSFILGDHALPEFQNIRLWRVEEKIDGTNIRIMLERDLITQKLVVRFGGRTKDAQIPCHLLDRLQFLFTPDKLEKAFPTLLAGIPVTLFGEGFGPKIQKGGGNYANEPGFILFDCRVGCWWLEREDIETIATKLSIPCVPILSYMTEEQIVRCVKSKPKSILNPAYGRMEGVVCKTDPLLLCRNGEPLMWKLKCKEFDE
jgi:hypothetical protein